MKAALVAWVALAGAAPASAQDDVAAFYRGQQLRMIVGSAVGGGYDLFARIVARHIVHHIPGNPVDRRAKPAGRRRRGDDEPALRPGAQGRHGDRRPDQRHPDGAAAAIGHPVRPTRLIWVGSTNREAYVAFVWHTVPVAEHHRTDHARKWSWVPPRPARPWSTSRCW